MYKRYEVTESNFEIVLARLQRTFNKYKAIEFYKVKKEGAFGYKNKSLGIRRNYKEIRGKYYTYPEFYCNSKYYEFTKHLFREEYERSLVGDEDVSQFNINLYKEMKSLIHINMGAGYANVIHEEDIVIFKPFGIVTIITHEQFINKNKETKCYHTYVPNVFKKIDIQEEHEKRMQEEKEYDEMMMREFESDFVDDLAHDFENNEDYLWDDDYDFEDVI